MMNIFAVIFVLQCLLVLAKTDVLIYTQYPLHQIIEEFRDVPAHFGDPLPATGLRGFAIQAEPSDGCSPMQAPPTDENFTGKWIVIIKRYNCSFEEKVRNAQTAKYDAVIVYNINSSELEPMSAKNPIGILIPSVFVGYETGNIILDNYQYKDGYFLILNSDLPFNFNTHLVLPFAIVVGMCFLIMVSFMIVKCVRERRRLQRHRLPSSVLKRIPTCKFTKGDAYETCAICLDDYLEGERLRVLPCSHAYHCKCIDPWLTKNRRVCPVCKRKVFGRNEVRTRSDSSSDSEPDDTTPLLNPVSNHGTFRNESENPFLRASQETARVNVESAESGECSRVEGPAETFSISSISQDSHLVTDSPSIQDSNVTDSHSIQDSNSEIQNEHENSDRNSALSVNVLSKSPQQRIGNNLLNPFLSGSFADDYLTDREKRERLDSLNVESSAHSINSSIAGVAAIPNQEFRSASSNQNDHFIV